MLPTRALRAAAQGAKRNVTGFNMRKFQEAAEIPKYDPWEQSEAWRYEGTFSRWNRFRTALPGLGTATVAFAGYCTYEYFFLNDEHHQHDNNGEAHADGSIH